MVFFTFLSLFCSWYHSTMQVLFNKLWTFDMSVEINYTAINLVVRHKTTNHNHYVEKIRWFVKNPSEWSHRLAVATSCWNSTWFIFMRFTRSWESKKMFIVVISINCLGVPILSSKTVRADYSTLNSHLTCMKWFSTNL